MKGKLIVFEGIDGSGKTTQAKLLFNFLGKKKINTEYISFPRYHESLWGQMVRRYLDGDFGEIDEVSPYFASMLYAGDRFSASLQLTKWISDGKIVVCNRYVGSNIGHMAAKIKKQSEKLRFIKWLEDLEYQENKIPREDLVIFLSIPVSVSQKLMNDRKRDIHEKNVRYLWGVDVVYQSLARQRKNWVRVECMKHGKLLSPEIIHLEILGVLKKRKFI